LNWDAIGAAGEVLGALAVVATLLYLARETRKSANAIDASASRDSARQISEWHLEASRDPEIRRIVMKSFSEEDVQYTEEEWFEFRALAISLFFQYQSHYIHSGLSVGSREESEMYIRHAKDLIESFPIWRRWWEQGIESRIFVDGFVDAVESVEDENYLVDVFKKQQFESPT
jgi:hypothetical protein